MLFARRVPLNLKERVRSHIWPTNGWRRTGKYFFKRLLRIQATPHTVALGLACGVFASFSPFFGFHVLIALAIAFLIRGNLIAAAIGTAFGNPVVLPFLFGGSYQLGTAILGARPLSRSSLRIEEGMMHQSLARLWPILEPLLIGSVILGLGAGVIAYFLSRALVGTYQTARKARFAARRAHLAERAHVLHDAAALAAHSHPKAEGA